MTLSVSDTYEVAESEGTAFFAARSKSAIGMPPNVTVPQPWRCVIARNLHATYFMNRVGKDRKAPVRFAAPGGHKFVEWTLEPSQSICFAPRYLVGFSETVKLRTIWTLQLTSLALGKMLYSAADGPGRIVFEACGQPEIYQFEPCGSSFPMDRLIAWTVGTEFMLTGFHGPLNILFDSLHLQPINLATLIVDADAAHHSKPSVLVSVAKRMYMPG